MGTRQKPATCVCGRTHDDAVTTIDIRDGALASLPDAVPEASQSTALLIFDHTTYELFRDRVIGALRARGLDGKTVVLGTKTEPFTPDERAVETCLAAVSEQIKVIVGIGSGAMNDLGKYIAWKRKTRYVCIATAPSMDGFAAPISALMVDGVRVTFPTKVPDVIIGDVDIVANAPDSLISAGFGDIVGKTTSLADWEIGHTMFDEYWCPELSHDIAETTHNVMQAARALRDKHAPAVKMLTKALVDVGVSVSFVGNSRPTSGSEHLLAHYLERWGLARQEPRVVHGFVVGIAAMVTSEIARFLGNIDIERLPSRVSQPDDTLEDVLQRLELTTVPDNFGKNKLSAEVRQQRLDIARRLWDEIRRVLNNVPSPETLRAALEEAGAPLRFHELGIDRDTAMTAVTYGRYLRERYTMLDLAADAGLLPSAVDGFIDRYI